MSSEKSININTLKSSDIQQINFTNGGSINDNKQPKNVSFEKFTNEPPIDDGSFEESDFNEFSDDMEDFGGVIDKEKLENYEKDEKDLNTYIGDLEEKNNENVESLEKFAGNLKNVNLTIIKEGGESNIEKMNKNLERLNKNIYNFNEKINNYGDANNEENDLENDNENNNEENNNEENNNEKNNEENTQFGGEVNMRVNEEYHQFQLQKSKEHYKELEKQIEEEIIEEEMEQQEFDMYNDFEDFEIDELSKEDVEIIVKDTENRLEYSDEVLFDNLVDVLRYNPDLMYNSDLPNKEDIKIFDRITISETSGKVELPPYLYKSGMPPYIRTKYGGSGSGNNKSIYDYVNRVMYEKDYFKYEQNYKQKFLLDTFDIKNNYRSYSSSLITPIILDKKMIFKNDYNENENLESYTFYYNNQADYLNSLMRFNPSKLGGSSNIKYLNSVREYNSIIRENYKRYNDNMITLENNISVDMDNLYMKNDNIELKQLYNDYMPSSIGSIGNSIKNNNIFNYYNYNNVYRISNKTFDYNKIEKINKIKLDKRRLRNPLYDIIHNECDELIYKNISRGELYNLIGFLYNPDITSDINKNLNILIFAVDINEINFLNKKKKENREIKSNEDIKYIKDYFDNLEEQAIILFYLQNNSIDEYNYLMNFINEYHIFDNLLSIKKIIKLHSDNLKCVKYFNELEEFFKYYNISLNEIENENINVLRNYITERVLEDVSNLRTERNNNIKILEIENKKRNNIIKNLKKPDIKINEKYPLNFNLEESILNNDSSIFNWLSNNIDNGLLNTIYNNETLYDNLDKYVNNMKKELANFIKERDTLTNKYNKLYEKFNNHKCNTINKEHNLDENTYNEINSLKKSTYKVNDKSVSTSSLFYREINNNNFINKCNTQLEESYVDFLKNLKNIEKDESCIFDELCKSRNIFYLKNNLNSLDTLIKHYEDKIDELENINIDNIKNYLIKLFSYNNTIDESIKKRVEKNIIDFGFSTVDYQPNLKLENIKSEYMNDYEETINDEEEVVFDNVSKMKINGKLVLGAAVNKTISIDNYSSEYKNIINKSNFNLLKRLNQEPNYSCEYISSKFKYAGYAQICKKLTPFLIKLNLNMNIEELENIIYDIYREIENLPSFAVKKLEYAKDSKIAPETYKRRYILEFDSPGSIRRSAIIVARLAIDIETHVPKYRFKESYKLKETRDADMINFYDDKISYLVEVGAKPGKLGTTGILMDDTQAEKLKVIKQYAYKYYEDFKELQSINYLYKNREIYDSKQEYLLYDTKKVNFQNYGVNLIFNGSARITDSKEPEELLKTLKKYSPNVITKNYLDNQMKNINYESYKNLINILKARSKYLTIYELQETNKIMEANNYLYNNPINPLYYGSEDYIGCNTKGTCMNFFIPEYIEDYESFNQIYKKLDTQKAKVLNEIQEELKLIDNISKIRVPVSILTVPTHILINNSMYDNTTMQYKFYYNVDDIQLFREKYCNINSKKRSKFNGINPLEYQDYLSKYCPTMANNPNYIDLTLENIEEIVKYLNIKNTKDLKIENEPNYYDYYKKIHNIPNDNMENYNKLFDILENNITEREPSEINKMKNDIYRKLGYQNKLYKTKEMKFNDEEENIVLTQKQKLLDYQEKQIRAIKEKNRLVNIKNIIIKYRSFMNLIKNDFKILINDYVFKRYSDESSNYEMTFGHLENLQINTVLKKPLFIPLLRNRNIFTIKERKDILSNRIEEYQIFNDIKKYASFIDDYEFLYTLEDIEEVFGEESKSIRSRIFKKSRFGNQKSGDVLIIYLTLEILNLFKKIDEIEEENVELNIKSSFANFIFNFFETQFDNLSMLDAGSAEIHYNKEVTNYNISKEENLLSKDELDIRRILIESGLEVEKDAFNNLDYQKEEGLLTMMTEDDDRENIDEKYNETYGAEGDDNSLYGGDEDDDYIDDENYSNIFDSDEYDNQYEYDI